MVIDLRPEPSPDRRGLATVIPMPLPARAEQGDDTAADRATAPEAQQAGDDIERAIDILERRYGGGWTDLPARLGRRAARAEALLAEGPTAFDPSTAVPSTVVVRARLAISVALTTTELLQEEAEILGEALAVDLSDLPLRRLRQVADAVVGLSSAPAAEPSWATPSTARAAEMVLQLRGAEVQAAADAHRALYEQFTDAVWDVPEARILAGRHRWRPIARLRLRSTLRDCSRTGHLPGRLDTAIDLVLATRATRRTLAPAATMLSNHLGGLDRGPLTDIDAALAALLHVRRLQRALGDRLDVERLAALLRADAFRTHDVVGPASNVRSALTAWARDVSGGDGSDAWSLTCGELRAWASHGDELLPALVEGAAAVIQLGAAVPNLRSLVDDLLARERIEELRDGDGERDVAHPDAADRPAATGSAS